MNLNTVQEPTFHSNCYIVFSRDRSTCIIIDPNDYDQISQLLQKTHTQIEYILLTHEHYDHLSALNECRAWPGAKVITSEACSNALPHVQSTVNRTYAVYLWFLEIKTEKIPQYNCESADIVVKNEYTFIWDENTITLKVLPGHSPGSIVILVNNTCLFSGDSLLKHKEVITKFLGGDKEVYKTQVIPYMKTLNPDFIIYPGHGVPFTLSEKIWE